MTDHADIDHTGLTGVGAGVDAGTSFPVSPSTHDLYYRTDRDLLYFYDGTRWLTVQVYKKSLIPKTLPDYTATATAMYAPAEAGTNFWVVDCVFFSRMQTASDASNYWTLAVSSADNTGNPVATLASRDTKTDSTSFVCSRVTAGALFGTSATWMILKATKTGSTGNVQWLACDVNYRLVG